jgi:hypothetical protein
MRLSAAEDALVRAFEGFEIVDAHEHLPPRGFGLSSRSMR